MAVAERVDVRRNRVRLLEATRRLFAREGVDVSVREVAAEAGVGVATVYRHFPSRDDLVDAVLEDAFEELVAAGQRALEEASGWTGFAGLVEETLVLCARNHGLREVFETRRGRERAESMRGRIRPVFAELVARAQAEGTLRSDFTAEDVPLLFLGAYRVIELTAGVAPELWRRQLGLTLDGLRAGRATALPVRALSGAELRRVERGRSAPPVRRPSVNVRRENDGRG